MVGGNYAVLRVKQAQFPHLLSGPETAIVSVPSVVCLLSSTKRDSKESPDKIGSEGGASMPSSNTIFKLLDSTNCLKLSKELNSESKVDRASPK